MRTPKAMNATEMSHGQLRMVSREPSSERMGPRSTWMFITNPTTSRKNPISATSASYEALGWISL